LVFVQQALLVERRGLYPNPFGALLHIYFRLRVAGAVSVSIYNVAGEPIRRIRVAGVAGDNVVDWAGVNDGGAECASGIYLLRVAAQGVDGTEGSYWDQAAAQR
jgi:hypothetical protein